MHTPDFNEQYRFGSAGWADECQMRDCGLFAGRGLPIGFVGRRRLHLEGDAPLITFGGAGTGKLTTVIGHVLCTVKDRSMIVLDPRGEIAATFLPALARHGIEAYFWNPFRLHGLPSHHCNPLDLIDPKKRTFHADCMLVAKSIVKVASVGEGKYFEQRGSDWIAALIKADAVRHGRTSLPSLMRIVNTIETGDVRWPDLLEAMNSLPFADVRRTAGEMIVKQQDSTREFGSVMGEIYTNLCFLDDPALAESLEKPDFSLEAVCSSSSPKIVFLMIPAEYLQQYSASLRLFLTACMIHKGRNPGAWRLLMLLDEPAQLGPFETLPKLYTYGRGLNIQTWTYWQNTGQTNQNYGPTGTATFLESSQVRQFLGARSYDTARLISDMLGTETLEYDDTRMQEEASRQKRLAVQRALSGDDVVTALLEAAHYNKVAQMRTKQARKLLTEQEVLSMSSDKQVLFVSGHEPLNVLADRKPYFECPELAGLYLPNPFHPPYDSVPIAGRWLSRRARVIREPVSEKFSSYAQYRDGTWAYVEGYKPM